MRKIFHRDETKKSFVAGQAKETHQARFEMIGPKKKSTYKKVFFFCARFCR